MVPDFKEFKQKQIEIMEQKISKLPQGSGVNRLAATISNMVLSESLDLVQAYHEWLMAQMPELKKQQGCEKPGQEPR